MRALEDPSGLARKVRNPGIAQKRWGRRFPRKAWNKKEGGRFPAPQIPEILETKEKRAYFFFAAGFFAAGFFAAFFAAFLAAAMVLTPPFGRWIDRTRAAC